MHALSGKRLLRCPRTKLLPDGTRVLHVLHSTKHGVCAARDAQVGGSLTEAEVVRVEQDAVAVHISDAQTDWHRRADSRIYYRQDRIHYLRLRKGRVEPP